LKYCNDAVSAARKVAYLRAPQNAAAALYAVRVKQAADALGIKLVLLPLTSTADLDGAFSRADNERVTAVLAKADTLTYRLSGRVIDRCLIRDLPAMHCWPSKYTMGRSCPMAPRRRRIMHVQPFTLIGLKGTKVAELPFEEPTEIKLVINLRTARSIGITLSRDVLARADEVIE
jgi:putative ABC transport system substrate-binding protein